MLPPRIKPFRNAKMEIDQMRYDIRLSAQELFERDPALPNLVGIVKNEAQLIPTKFESDLLVLHHRWQLDTVKIRIPNTVKTESNNSKPHIYLPVSYSGYFNVINDYSKRFYTAADLVKIMKPQQVRVMSKLKNVSKLVNMIKVEIGEIITIKRIRRCAFSDGIKPLLSCVFRENITFTLTTDTIGDFELVPDLSPYTMQEVIQKYPLPVKLRISGAAYSHEPDFLSRIKNITHPITIEEKCSEEYYVGCSFNCGHKKIILFSRLATLQFYVSDALLTGQRDNNKAVDVFGPTFTLSNLDVIRLLKFDFPPLVVESKKEDIYRQSPILPRRTTRDCTVPIMEFSKHDENTAEITQSLNQEYFDKSHRSISMKSIDVLYMGNQPQPVVPMCKRILAKSAPQLDHQSSDDSCSIEYAGDLRDSTAISTAAVRALPRQTHGTIVDFVKNRQSIVPRPVPPPRVESLPNALKTPGADFIPITTARTFHRLISPSESKYSEDSNSSSSSDCRNMGDRQKPKFATLQRSQRKKWMPFRNRRKLSQAKSDTDVREKPDNRLISRNASMNTPAKSAKSIKRRYQADPLPSPNLAISASAGNLCDVGKSERYSQHTIDNRPAMPLPSCKGPNTREYIASKSIPILPLPSRPPPLPPRGNPNCCLTRPTDTDSEHTDSSTSYEVMSKSPDVMGPLCSHSGHNEDTYTSGRNYIYPWYRYKHGRLYQHHKHSAEYGVNVNTHDYVTITSGLSISQVIENIKSLKLNVACEDKILDQGIDGALLVDMSKKLIKESLDVTELDALKIYKFAHKGWKPLFSNSGGDD